MFEFVVVKNIKTPTGNIIIANTPEGYLEFLSLADYGQKKNIKADFLGLKDEINGVPHGDTLPLEEKWVITISTQYWL
jgi:23S rRNA (adenine2503-C2)-methyltransferase